MFNRRHIMTAAWSRYRATYGKSAFKVWAFREALRIEWSVAKRAARVAAEAEARRAEAVRAFNAQAAPAPVMSEMEARIDALKYLPFGFDIGQMAASIRAERASTGAAR